MIGASSTSYIVNKYNRLKKEGKIKPRTVKPLEDSYRDSSVLVKKVLENKKGKKENQTERQFTNQ